MITALLFDERGYWIGDDRLPEPWPTYRKPKPVELSAMYMGDAIPDSVPVLPEWEFRRIDCYGLPQWTELYVEHAVPFPPPWPLQMLLWCRAAQHVADGLVAAGAPYRAAESRREALKIVAGLRARVEVDKIVRTAAAAFTPD